VCVSVKERSMSDVDYVCLHNVYAIIRPFYINGGEKCISEHSRMLQFRGSIKLKLAKFYNKFKHLVAVKNI
jgi:hypothetical protein